jgi:hypothetical protein
MLYSTGRRKCDINITVKGIRTYGYPRFEKKLKEIN